MIPADEPEPGGITSTERFWPGSGLQGAAAARCLMKMMEGMKVCK